MIPINYARGLLSTSDSFGLEELTTRLSASGTDLFSSAKPPPFPSRWKSLASGYTKIIRVEGQHIYVETVLRPEERQAGLFDLAELAKKDGEKYTGVVRTAFLCSWNNWTQGQNMCKLENKVEITSLTPTRIEGSVLTYPAGARFDCGKCQWSGKLQMQPFVWIPE